MATIEPNTTVCYCTEAQRKPKTGVLAMMEEEEGEPAPEGLLFTSGWLLSVDSGEAIISSENNPDGEEETVEAGDLLLGLSASTATRLQTFTHGVRVWVVDEDAWERVSSVSHFI